MPMNQEKLCIPYPVIVEGKYDRLRLLSVMDGQIIPTDGFGVFRSKEKQALLRALAKDKPIIVLTDSDGAGKLIRAHLHGIVPPERIISIVRCVVSSAFIPCQQIAISSAASW